MTISPLPPILSAEIVLPAGELRATIDFFVKHLGFRVDGISPADSPTTAVLSGHGTRLRLRPGGGHPGLLRLAVSPGPARLPEPMTAPNGTQIEWFDPDPPIELPPAMPELVITRRPDADGSGIGRAGMRYRDLLPNRHGGRFIASHISIPDGGPVPDYVHFHKIRFQMIFCRRGWVRLVYEDQGPPFVLEAGDCVLQPPLIRHRVLEASPGLEVVEIASPALHQTSADHELLLPNDRLAPERDFGGQRFVRHHVSDAVWAPWRDRGFEAADLGLDAATAGLAEVRRVRSLGKQTEAVDLRHGAEFAFWYVLAGTLHLEVDGESFAPLRADDCVTIPAAVEAKLNGASADLELLEVVVP